MYRYELFDAPFELDLTPVTLGDFMPKTGSEGLMSFQITGTNFLVDPYMSITLEDGSMQFGLYFTSITDTQIVAAPLYVLSGTYKVIIDQFGKRYEFPGTVEVSP